MLLVQEIICRHKGNVPARICRCLELQWPGGYPGEHFPVPKREGRVIAFGRLLHSLGHRTNELVAGAALRSTSEILDALDLHFRLHWAARQAGLDKEDPPAELDSGVISERHYALNWLVCFEDADWDDVDTPT